MRRGALFSLLILVFLSTKVLGDITSGLVAHYEFEDNVVDSAGGDNDGTATNITYTTGKYGKAGSFNGSSSKVDLSTLTGFPDTTTDAPYAISAWVNLASYTHRYGIISWGSNAGGSSANAFSISSTDIIHNWWGTDLYPSSVVPADSNWHLVVAMYDGTTQSIWIDGTQVASQAASGHNAALSAATIGTIFGGDFFSGLMDDVRIYNRALASADITELYNYIPPPQTFTVTSTADSGAGTLRQAVTDALAGDTIVFDSSLANSTIDLSSGKIIIDKDITIDGSAAPGLAITSTHSYGAVTYGHLFNVNSGINLTISDLIFKDVNSASYTASLIFTDSGSFHIKNSHFINNNLLDGVIDAINSGSFIVESSSFISNTVVQNGIIRHNGTVSSKIINSTIANNNTGYAGGIWVGGILYIDSSTIVNNTASNNGGGIRVINNASYHLHIKNSVVHGNTGTVGPDIETEGSGQATSYGNNYFGTLSGAGNLSAIGSDTVSSTDPKLGTLTQDDDGVTWAYPLTSGSPLIDGGSCTGIDSSTITYDQFGDTRDDGNCDIGSREYIAPDITSGLIHHHLCEGTLYDEVTNITFAQDATVEYSTDGKFGEKSCSFNDDEVWYTFDETGVDSLTDTGTVAFWIKAADIAGTAVHIVDAGLSGGTLIHNDGTNTLKVTSPSTNLSVSAGDVMDSTWHHVVVVSDGSSSKLYVDGVLKDSAATSLEFSKGDAGDTHYVLSDTSGGGHANSLNALIDDARVYNRALSSSDVIALYNNTPAKVTMKAHGGAVQLVGANNYIESSNMDIPTSFTLEAWINPATDTEKFTIISKNTSGNPTNNDTTEFVLQRVQTAKNLRLLMGDGSGFSLVESTSTIPSNQWTHVSATYDNTDKKLRVYINGVEDGMTGLSGIRQSSNTTPIQIGRHENSTESWGNGLLDELRVWNTAKTADEIKASMNQQLDPTAHSDLVAYYNFDERRGNNIVDLVGGDYNGTIVGDVTRVNFLGDGLEFDSTNGIDGINLGDIFNAPTAFTYSAWVKLNDTYDGQYDNIIRKNGVDSLQIYQSKVQVSINKSTDGSNGTLCTSTTTLAKNRWYYVSGIYSDADNKLEVYINGELDKTCTESFSAGTSTNNRVIGNNSAIGAAEPQFDGNIAEVSMWNKVLTSEVINATMHSSLLESESGLVGYWPLNEGTGTTVYDRSSNNNNGTITGATWTDTAPKVHGDSLNTDFGIKSWQKLIVENNTSAPTFSISGSGVSNLNSSTGLFFYNSLYGDDTLIAIDISNDINFTINTRTLTNVITGTSGDDTLTGSVDDDLFSASSGNDIIDGQDGNDTVIYSGNQSTYTVVDNEDGTYKVTDGTDSDTLSNIELLSFENNQNVDISSIAIVQKLTLEAHGGVVQLVGTANYIETSLTDVPDSFTIEAWINPKTASDFIIASKLENATTNGTNNEAIEFDFKLGSTGGLGIIIGGTSAINTNYAHIAANNNPLPINQWSHVAATYSATTKKARLYVNGDEITYDTNKDPDYQVLTSVSRSKGTTEPLLIGRYVKDIVQGGNGLLDEVRVWNTARSQSDINASKNLQLDGNETGLVAYYNFDERRGDNIVDLVGGDNNGKIIGDVTRVNFLGEGLEFDGVDDKVDLGNSTDFNIGANGITVSAWINSGDLNSGSIIGNSSDPNQYGYVLRTNSSGQLNFASGNGTSWDEVKSPINSFELYRWYYVAAVQTSTSQKLYIDGELVASNTGNYTFSNPVANTTIGLDYGTRYFTGKIAEVSMWDRELIESDIQLLMHSSLRGDELGLVGYWPLNEENSVTARDYTSNVNDGTITGAIWTDTAPEIYGDTIYSDFEINSWQKLELKSSSLTAAFTQTPANANVTHFDSATGRFLYASVSGDENISFGETSESLTLNIQTRSATSVIVGTSNSENLTGTADDDIILGDSGNDTLYGLDGNDTLEGGLGTDTLDGGAGTDTVVFDGNRSNYTVVDNFNGTYTVTGTDGTDTLTNIEYLSFDDERDILITGLFVDITSGLVAHYEFEGDATDSSGNGYNGVETAISYSSGKFGLAASFDGSSSYIDIASAGVLPANIPSGNSPRTVAFWAKPISSTPATQGNMISWGSSSANSRFSIMQRATGKLDFIGGSNDHSSNYTMSTSWQHIVMIYDGSTNIDFYVDGEFESSITVTELTTDLVKILRLGVTIEEFQDEYYSGLLDDVRIYDRALNSFDVSELYKDGNEPKLTLEAHGGVLQFDGNSSYVDLGDSFENLGTYTAEAWIKLRSYPATGGFSDIVTKMNVTSFVIYDGGHLAANIGDGIDYGDHAVTPDPIPLEEWHHVAMTADGNLIKVYVDGILEQNVTQTKVMGENSDENTIGGVLIGGNPYNFFDGEMDEVRVWNIARTQEEIYSHMNHQLDGNESGLIAYYNFDERVGESVVDITGNGNDGAIHGDVQRVNFLGSHLKFYSSGSGEHVDLGDIIENQTQLSHVAWIKLDEYAPSGYSGAIIAKYQVDYISVDDSGKFFSRLGYGDAYEPNTNCSVDSKTLELDRYYHVAMTTDSDTNETKLYIDGNLEKICNTSIVTGENTSLRSIGSFSPSSTSSYRFRGDIFEVSSWSKVLTQSEIKQLMVSAPDKDRAYLAGYWPLNEGVGTHIEDRSLNNYDGNITGATWTDTAPEIYGDKIYTSFGINSFHKLQLENGSGSETYSFTGDIPNHIILDENSGVLKYSGNLDENFIVSAYDNGVDYSLDLKVRSYGDLVEFSLINLDPIENNVTDMKLLGVGDTLGSNIELITDDGINWYGGVREGNYTIRITVSDNNWWYNLTDGKIYDIKSTNDFRLELTSATSIIINAATSNWDDSRPIYTVSTATQAELEAQIANAVEGGIVAIDPSIGSSEILFNSTVSINKNIFIEGLGADSFSFTSSGDTLFNIVNGTKVSISGLTFKNATSSAIVNDGNLTILDSEFINNSTLGDGGAIYNGNGAGLKVIGSTFMENNATVNGGAIYVDDGSIAKILNSTLTKNVAEDGGAIYVNTNGTAKVAFTTIAFNISGVTPAPTCSDNYDSCINETECTTEGWYWNANLGSCLDSDSGDVCDPNSSSYDYHMCSGDSMDPCDPNSTMYDPGDPMCGGGDPCMEDPMMCASGGGIYSAGSNVFIINSIIANNIDMMNHAPDIFGTVQSYGFNLIGSTQDATINPVENSGTDLLDTPASFGSLTVENGSTKLYPLLPTSLAVDRGSCVKFDGNITTSQNGVTRSKGYNCDIGSYESSYFASLPGEDINVTINFSTAPTSLTNVKIYAIDANRSSGFYANKGGYLDVNLSGSATKTINLSYETESIYLVYEVNSSDYIRSAFAGSAGTVYSFSDAVAFDVASNSGGVSITIESGNIISGTLSGYDSIVEGMVFPISTDGREILDIGSEINSSNEYSLKVPNGNYKFKFYVKDANGLHRDYYSSTGAVKMKSLGDVINVTADTTLDLGAGSFMGARTLEFNSGWNLLSIPAKGIYDLADIHAMFDGADVSHIVKYNQATSWNYLWLDDELATNEYSRFSEINSHDGFWLKANSAGSITIPFSGYENSYGDVVKNLRSGFCLIGFPVDKSVASIVEAVENFNATTIVDAVWIYRGGAWYVHYPHTTVITSTLSSSDIISATEGIWVKIR